jgi:hypothetical protein
VSARHQVNGWTVLSKSSLFRKPVRQKKQAFFVRADPRIRNFTGNLSPK